MLRSLTCLLLICSVLPVTLTPAGAHGDRVDELTRQLKSLQAQSQGTAPASEVARGALRITAIERRDALLALMTDRPDEVVRHRLSSSERAALPADVQDLIENDEDTEGDLEVLHEDGPAGSRYLYFLDRGADRLSLHFVDSKPGLQTGDRVRVSGLRVGQALALGSSTSQLTVLAAALPNTFGAQNTAVILVNFKDKPTQTWVTPAEAQSVVFGTAPQASVSNFYREGSYQQTWLTGDVYGVFTIQVASTVC